MSDDDADETVLLDVLIPQAKDFIAILKGVAFRELCTLRFFSNGLRLAVDDGIELQANAYFKVEFFHEYTLNVPEVSICVKAKVLLQAMNTFQSNFAARLIYRAHGDPLKIRLENQTMEAEVTVPTREAVDLLNIHCDPTSLPVKILFSPNFLREILVDIDQSCQTVKFKFLREKIHIETKGEVYQLTEAETCDENTEEFLVVNALDEGVTVCFRVEHLRKCIAILKSAKRAALRVDSNGVLCIQLMLEHDGDMITYVDFLVYRCAPEDEDEALLDQLTRSQIQPSQQDGPSQILEPSQRVAQSSHLRQTSQAPQQSQQLLSNPRVE